ncbi:MAG: SGNH/GDSL hydrolase family protein [Candidatus Methylacidiphilales bacterium]|nr:SGNH/GDSL hydrolase family protein [Candidatus Methylacidiphilales bacterium]
MMARRFQGQTTMRYFLVLSCLIVGPLCGWSQSPPANSPSPSTEIIGHEKDYTAANAEAAKAKSPTEPMPAAELHARGGLPRLFAKINRGETVILGYYGGSITAAPGWRTMTMDWFSKTFPKAKFELVNASVGGSGSLVGVFRADDDLVAKKPDVVFIEFSLNDGSDVRDRPEEVTGALEGIIRKLRTANPDVDICFAYTVTAEMLQKAQQGICSNSISLHDRVAAHYNLPSINMGMEAAKLFAEGKLIHQAPKTPDGLTADGKIIFSNDGSHPSEKGHVMNGEAAIRGLQQLSQIPPGETGPRPLPEPLSPLPWDKAKTIAADGRAEFKGDWAKLTAANGPSCRRFGKNFYNWFPFLYRTIQPGASMTVRFRGTHIGFKGMEGPDSGVITVSVDGGAPVKKVLFTVYANAHVYVGAPLPAVPMGDHTAVWTLTDEVPPKEELLKKKNTDADFRNNPDKYKENSFSVGQIIVLGDLLDAWGQPLP